MKQYILLFLLLLQTMIGCKNSTKVNFEDCKYVKENKRYNLDNYLHYYKRAYLSDSLFIEGEYSCSYEILHALFEEFEPINMEEYYEFEKYLISSYLIGNHNNLCEKLELLITRYGYNKSRIENNKHLREILNSCSFVSNKIDSLYDKYLSSIKLDLREQIYLMKNKDQKYRKRDVYQNNLNRQDSIDMQNTKKLIEIFNVFGYPNYRLIGDYAIDKRPVNIRILLLHTKDSIRKKFFIPKLFEYVLKGDCEPKTLGLVVDQLHLYNGEEQVYGTYENEEISDIKKIDSIRESIGLPKYGYEAWRRNKIYGGKLNFDNIFNNLNNN